MRVHLSALATIACVAGLHVSAAGPSLRGVGDLEGGAYFSWAVAVSPDGTAVVGSSKSEDSGPFEAFLWTEPGGMTGLGYLCGPNTAKWSDALGVSLGGSVVVGESTSDFVQYWEGFWWSEPNGMDWLIPPPPPAWGFWSRAYDVSADGATVVGAQCFPHVSILWEALKWVWDGTQWQQESLG